jgi:Flp pilus assembly protein TadD
VNWDDPFLLLNNPSFRGLSPRHLAWMFTNVRENVYQPLAWMTLGLDYALWGMEPGGFHLDSLLWHAACAVLVLLVARRALALGRGERAAGNEEGALLAALLFAVHPLRAEAVAWASERRELVGDFFWLLGAWFYLRGPAKRAPALAPVAACLLLALLAKGTMLSLPLVLLALDYYPLRRVGSARELARRVLEKWPLFALCAAFGALGAWAAMAHGEDGLALVSWTLPQRLAQISYGLAFYARKTLWPSGLAYLYKMPLGFDPAEPRFVLSAASVIAAAAAVWLGRRRFPAGLAAAAAYAGALLPVVGVMKYGRHLAADRYSNLSCVALAVLAGAGFAALVARARPAARAATWAVALALVALLGTLSRTQTATWRDSIALWSRALEVEPDRSEAHGNLGVAAVEAGDFARAEKELSKAAAIDPQDDRTVENWGAFLSRRGRWEEAAEVFESWSSRAPRSARARARLALALARTGRPARAEAEYRAALALDGGDAEFHHDFGVLLQRVGKGPEARAEFEKAVALDGSLADARVNLGLLLAESGHRADAYPHFRAALVSGDAEQRALAHFDWGNALSEDGRLAEAARHYREALRLTPALLDARFNLGNTLARLSRYEEAAREYRALLARAPSYARARNNLAAVRRLAAARTR